MHPLIENNRQSILSIAHQHGVKKIRLFGSMACQDAKRNSDVDFLVEFEKGRSLFDQIHLMHDLEKLLHRKIDIASESKLDRIIKSKILKEAISLRTKQRTRKVMKMEKRYSIYVTHILDSLKKISHYTKKSKSVFMRNTLIQDAVIRKFEIIGEAVKRIPLDVQKLAPEIPWKEMVGIRNILLHQLDDDIDAEKLWQTIEKDTCGLEEQISVLLDKLNDSKS